METVTFLEVKVEPTAVMEDQSTICLMCLQPIENEELKLLPEMMSSIVSLATALEMQKLHSVKRTVFSGGMEQGSYCKKCYSKLHKLNVLHNRVNGLQESIRKLETKLQDEILVAYFKDGNRLDQYVPENELVAELSRQLYKASVQTFDPDRLFNNDDFDPEFDSNGYEDASRDGQDYDNINESSDVYTHSRRKSFRVRTSTYKVREKDSRSSSGESDDRSNSTKYRMDPNATSSCDKLQQRTSVQLKRLKMDNSNLDSNQKLKTHQRISKDRTRHNFNCSKCCAKFKKTSHLVGHVDKVHSSSEYDCSHCSGTFNNARNLKIHKDLYHPPSAEVQRPGLSAGTPVRRRVGEKNISCPECSVRFTHLTHFKTHLEKKHSESLGNYQHPCPVCPTKVFFTEQRLDAHLNKHHLVLIKAKNHRCEECDRSFLKKGDLMNHISTHSEARAFVCEICGVRTKRSQELQRHKKMIHASERPFICDTCGKRFTCKWQLAFHMKNHQSQRDFTCSVQGCLKTFKFPGNLKQHMLVHEGIKYICHFCGESYTRTGYLKKHIKLLHTEHGVNFNIEARVAPRKKATRVHHHQELRIDLNRAGTHAAENVAELNNGGLQFEYVDDASQQGNYDEAEVDSESEYVEGEEVPPGQPLQVEYCQIVNVNQDRQGNEYIVIQK